VRPTTFIFAFFYLISSVGYGLEIHYCLGEISDINYVLLDTECPCDASHTASNQSCCEEKAFFNQLEDEHAAPAKLSLDNVELPLVSILDLGQIMSEALDEELGMTLTDRGPPVVRDIPIELVRLITYG